MYFCFVQSIIQLKCRIYKESKCLMETNSLLSDNLNMYKILKRGKWSANWEPQNWCLEIPIIIITAILVTS